MAKIYHEIRDPIHVFVYLDSDEREVLNSRPLQRLRHIHQLGLTYLVYPGATHMRFEHSLGVMELAGKVFDVITHKDTTTDDIRNMLEDITHDDRRKYWRRVLRMAALCHDIGHLPFSHSAEDLLPDNWDHERLTREIILSNEMNQIWSRMIPPLKPEHIVKLAVGPSKAGQTKFSPWEGILYEIIASDIFGVDRMDYLLRDSHHAGVVYGKFDHYRLIDTLRILPYPSSGQDDQSGGLTLGVQKGGLLSAEALLVARYFMFSQLYYHPVRRIYDLHLRDFLAEWLEGGKFPVAIEEHLQLTDHEVTAGMLKASREAVKPGYGAAKRICDRQHFRVLYERTPTDVKKNTEAGKVVFEAAKREFGEGLVRHDEQKQKGGAPDFPVQTKDNRIESALAMSETIRHLRVAATDYVFIAPDKRQEAIRWLERERDNIIVKSVEEDD